MAIKRNALVTLALGILAIGTAAAQKPERTPPSPQTMAALSELKTTMSSWAQSNVLPSLRSWKSKLDGAMSAGDLQTLNGLRARAATLRKDMAAGMREMKKGDRQANREKMKGFGDQRKAIMEELKPLATKYRPTLESLAEEAKPKFEEWKKSGLEIAQKWYAENKDVLGDRGGEMLQHGLGFMGKMDGQRMKQMAAAYFMLWDGGDPIEQLQQEMGGNGPSLD